MVDNCLDVRCIPCPLSTCACLEEPVDLKGLAHEWSEQRDCGAMAGVMQTGADNVESLWTWRGGSKNTLEGELRCQLAAHPR